MDNSVLPETKRRRIQYPAEGTPVTPAVDVSALLVESRAKFQAKQYAEALVDLVCILSIDPYHIEALLLRSKLYLQQEAFGNALIDANTILERRPYHVAP